MFILLDTARCEPIKWPPLNKNVNQRIIFWYARFSLASLLPGMLERDRTIESVAEIFEVSMRHHSRVGSQVYSLQTVAQRFPPCMGVRTQFDGNRTDPSLTKRVAQ